MLSQRHSGRQTETDAQSKAPRKTDQDRCSVKGTQEDRLGRRQEDKEGRRPRAEKKIRGGNLRHPITSKMPRHTQMCRSKHTPRYFKTSPNTSRHSKVPQHIPRHLDTLKGTSTQPKIPRHTQRYLNTSQDTSTH
ncbi:hypothetical protein RRG08_054099 [Elysia crispata]|uniref:Uncharacterized protein n=1 Tax=Elysia crispata TaxID=231223 RepID=A0AAE0ZE09_9GAST|nr:hypothetical protein RRG08_054099 [Elysia crispata]